MNSQPNPPEEKEIAYELDKITFFIEPVYKEGEQESVADILLKLMLNDM